MAEYIIHKVVNASAVIKKNQHSLAWYGANYDAQRKYDGCCAVIVTAELGNDQHAPPPHGMSRTGEFYPSLYPAADALNEAMGAGFVLLGEAWWPGKDQQSLISGEFRRNAPSDKLIVIVNDCLTQAEFDAGYSAVPYKDRIARVPVSQSKHWGLVGYLAAGTYGDPQAACNLLLGHTGPGGYDGIVLVDPNGTWTKGNGTTGEKIKIKRVLSFDLLCTGIKEGKGKNAGRAGAIKLDYLGKDLWCNCGTDEERVAWWADPSLIVGKIVEIEAMDDSAHGLLREPRFKGIRFDKISPDT